MKLKRKQARRELIKDLTFILIGAVITIIFSKIGLIDWFIAFLGNDAVTSFVAGIFFTSAFTIAPSSAAFAGIAATAPLGTVVFWGALGAMCGDLILFLFIRDRFTEDLKYSLKPSVFKHIIASFHLGFIKWIAPIIGALIIASPLPDELGLALMGLSKTKIIALMPISFVMNMLGIYSITWLSMVI